MGSNDHIDWDLQARIADIVDEGSLVDDGTPAYGIAQQVIHQGYDSLSPKQRHVYDTVVIPMLEKREDELEVQRIRDMD